MDTQNRKGTLFFHEDRSKYNDLALTVSSSLVAEKSNIDNSNGTEVDLIDLDAYIASLDQPVDVLKMDVEGAEIDILEKIIQNKTYKKIRLLLIETHEKKIPSHVERVKSLKKTIEEQGLDHIKLNWI